LARIRKDRKEANMAANLVMTRGPENLRDALVNFVNVATHSLALQSQKAPQGVPPAPAVLKVNIETKQWEGARHECSHTENELLDAQREFYRELKNFDSRITDCSEIPADEWCSRQTTLRYLAERYILAAVRHACTIHSLVETKIGSVAVTYTCPPVECDGPSVGVHSDSAQVGNDSWRPSGAPQPTMQESDEK
jgi:hypothetical protein